MKESDRSKPEWDERSSLNSYYFNSMGQRETMRIFITYENDRAAIDVPRGRTVFKLKQFTRKYFNINENRAQLGDENQERPVLAISYCGSELHDSWILSDLFIPTGSTLKAYIKEELDPLFYFEIVYDQQIIPILDRLRIRDFSMVDLRRMISKRTGLPVGVFRLISPAGEEMFDCNRAEYYDIKPGDTMKLEIWDGMSEILRFAKLGSTEEFINRLPNCFYADEAFGRFCCRVGLYIAAHFGHSDLANALMKQTGVKADEYVGVHPHRQWCVGVNLAQKRGRINDRSLKNNSGFQVSNRLAASDTFVENNELIEEYSEIGDNDHEIMNAIVQKKEAKDLLEEEIYEIQRKIINAKPHPDIFKAPIHEATENNQIAILRLFVQNNILALMCRDGEERLPMNIALRTKQKKCASYILTKQWTRIPYKNTTLSLNVVSRMKKWAEIGRERSAFNMRIFNKRKTIQRDVPLVGEAITVDGFSKSEMTSGPDMPRKRDIVASRSVQVAGMLETEAHAKNLPYNSNYAQQILDPMSYFATMFQLQKLQNRNSSVGSKTLQQPKFHRTNLLNKKQVRIGDAGLFNPPVNPASESRESPAFKGPFMFSPDFAKHSEGKSSHGKTGLKNPLLPRIEEKKKKQEHKIKNEGRNNEILSRLPVPSTINSFPLPSKYRPLPRPFYYTLPSMANPIDEFLEKYENMHRKIPARQLAKHCMMLATSFTQKPWLSQVNIATQLVSNLVKKSVSKQNSIKDIEA